MLITVERDGYFGLRGEAHFESMTDAEILGAWDCWFQEAETTCYILAEVIFSHRSFLLSGKKSCPIDRMFSVVVFRP